MTHDDRPAPDPDEVDSRNVVGMQRLLAQKRQREREQRAPRPTAKSDQRKYGKRGWTWTP